VAETIQDRARNMARMFAPSLLPPGNAPAQMTGRLHPYYEGETAQFRERYAQYAADYFEAEVQGLDPEDFFAWAWEYIRFSDIAGLTATSTYLREYFRGRCGGCGGALQRRVEPPGLLWKPVQ